VWSLLRPPTPPHHPIAGKWPTKLHTASSGGGVLTSLPFVGRGARRRESRVAAMLRFKRPRPRTRTGAGKMLAIVGGGRIGDRTFFEFRGGRFEDLFPIFSPTPPVFPAWRGGGDELHALRQGHARAEMGVLGFDTGIVCTYVTPAVEAEKVGGR